MATNIAHGINERLDAIGAPPKHKGRIRFFADKTGFKEGTVYRWLEGTGMPSLPNLVVVADALGCTIDFLVGRNNFSDFLMETKDVSINTAHIPYVDNPGAFSEIPVFALTSFAPHHSPALKAFIVVGDEMQGYAEEGDCVFFDSTQRELAHGTVIAFEMRNRFILRRLQLMASDRISLLCDNKLYSSEMLDYKDFCLDSTPGKMAILGRVVGRLSA